MPGKDLNRWTHVEGDIWTRKIEPPDKPPTVKPTPAQPTEAPIIDATTGARELAAKHKLDLTAITGSGKDGRITKADVEETLGS